MNYSKQFLIDVYLSKFLNICSIEELEDLEANASKLFDRVGKVEFRKYASLDAAAIKAYTP